MLRHGFFLGAVVVWLTWVPSGAPGRTPQEPHASVLPEEIVGVALYPDGSTPIVELPVRVWSIERGKMIFRSRTDEHGVFRIPRIDAGNCYVFVGRVKINLEVLVPSADSQWQRHDLVLVMPRKLLQTTGARLLDVLVAPALLILPDDLPVMSP